MEVVMEKSTALIDPRAAAFSRIVMEGANGRSFREACEAGLTCKEVRIASRLHRADRREQG
jgi:hypothetical protein